VLLGRVIDAPLDARGAREAQALAERLTRERPARIQASPRRRTRETADAIAALSHAPVCTAPELDEIDFGAWAGLSFTALMNDPQWRRWNTQRSSARTPAGVDIGSVQEYIVGYLRQLAQVFAGATLVLVTHAEIIRAALLHFLRLPADDYHRIEISPASLTTLRLQRRQALVDHVNERVLQ